MEPPPHINWIRIVGVDAACFKCTEGSALRGRLRDAADTKLLKLRNVRADRYSGPSVDELLNRSFEQPALDGLDI